jgi:hypothetical protein
MHKIVSGKSEVKKELRVPIQRRENNTRIIVKETGCEFVGLIHLTQESFQLRIVLNPVMKLRVL